MKQPFGFNLECSYKQLPRYFYEDVVVDRLVNPRYIVFNEDLANELRLDSVALKEVKGASFLAGQTLDKSITPIALAYAGHQYGKFTLLGDGRAALLGEHVINKQRFDIHLKGSGPTKYARGFDGKATKRSMLLEYLISEALYALGIPTTRSLAVIKTNETIRRVRDEEGAVLVRVAKSHLRVGTFEYAYHKAGIEGLRSLVDYAINRHDKSLINDSNKVIKWYAEVVKRQARLVAKWQSVGFVHGVMNTDNTTISGETIDYGPCAFIDAYDLKSVYSSIDYYGRYAFGQQPHIMSWNIAKLGEIILPLIDKDKGLAIKKVQAILSTFGNFFETEFYAIMGRKLGLGKIQKTDIHLIDELLEIMAEVKIDYTYVFYALSRNINLPEFETEVFQSWMRRWKKRLVDENEAKDLMMRTNPVMIPRNYLVKEVLDKAAYAGDLKPYENLLALLRNPFNDKQIPIDYIEPPKDKEPFVTFCGT